MLHRAKFATGSEINTKYLNTVWAECTDFRSICKIAKSDYQLRHGCPSDRQSAWNNSAPKGRIIMKFDIRRIFENLSRKFKFHLKSEKEKGSLHQHQYTFKIIYTSLLLRRRNASDKMFRENQNTHFKLIIFFKYCRL